MTIEHRDRRVHKPKKIPVPPSAADSVISIVLHPEYVEEPVMVVEKFYGSIESLRVVAGPAINYDSLLRLAGVSWSRFVPKRRGRSESQAA